MSNQKERRIAVRAGLFIALGLTLFGLVILLIGRERRLFDPQISFHALFGNVDGLKKDSPVWLGGLEVGKVTQITFSPDLGDKRINVQMEIGKRFSERVRADSVARLVGRGVLGDKAVDITLGSAEGTLIVAGGEIQSGVSGDLSSLLKASGEIMENAIAISRTVRTAVEGYTDPALRKDVTNFVASASHLLGAVEKGDGPLHMLFFDKQAGGDVKLLLGRATQVAAHVDRTVSEVDGILADVRTGNGTIHALLYDPKGAKAIRELGDAADELSGLVHDAKVSKNGAVHQLVYGDSSGMFADLGGVAKDLKKVTGMIARGEGTLGALVTDPTVYDDLRTVLGNVKRNRVLRALVRYSISNGEDLDKVGKPQEAPVKGKAP